MYMFRVESMIPIWIISVYCRTRFFVHTCSVPPWTNPEYLFSQQKSLSVNHLYNCIIGIFIHKFSIGMLPEMFDNLSRKIKDSRSYHTWQSPVNHLYVICRSTIQGQGSCIFSNLIIWDFIVDNFNTDSAISLLTKRSQLLFLTQE